MRALSPRLRLVTTLTVIAAACSVDRRDGGDASGGRSTQGGAGGKAGVGGRVSDGGSAGEAGPAGAGPAGDGAAGQAEGGSGLGANTGGAPDEFGGAGSDGAQNASGGARAQTGGGPGVGTGGAAVVQTCTAGASRCESNGKLSVCVNGAWQVSNENFNFNPDHCGGCGHSCLGGDCSAGQCQPIALAVGESSPTGLTLDEKYVYFTSARSGFIKRVDKGGSGLPETIANNRSGWPRDIVMAAGSLFFTEGPYVYRLVPDGSKLPEVWYNKVWGDDVAWELSTDSGQAGVSAAQTTVMWWDTTNVFYGAAAAATVQGSAVERGGPGEPGDVLLDKSFFFWTRRGNGHNNGSVYARTRSSSPVDATVASMVGHPVALAFDGNYLYWALAGLDDDTTTDPTDVKPKSGAIYRAAFVTGTQTWQAPQLLVKDIQTPWDMLVDENWVYWTSYEEGTVNKVAKAGGAKVPLVTGEVMPFNLVQDKVSIYWTRNVHPNGGVARLAK